MSSALPFRAAIFDLDGVLVDSARLHFVAWKRLADELGIAFDADDNEALKGVDRMGSLDHILKLGGVTRDRAAREALAARKNGFYLDALTTMGEADVLPGARRLLADARAAGLAIGVASASRNAVTVLDRAGLTDAIDHVADAAAARSKPAPDIFLACATALDVPPAECVGFEDAAAGVEAIKAAGMVAIGIGEPDTLAKADLIFATTDAVDLATVLRLSARPQV
ncbi:beta-phosphoglucomutase [Sphingomonas sp. PAMC 26605]|uniref:beta-phosphoglucomutase n=1 Tax=Sphingomonas sp. PAMC 26605 TaxID=1112214 RepID=UPI00026CA767|nr:beta-phosphoglucomutase [Sphingomonas sp. PAMC 26605]